MTQMPTVPLGQLLRRRKDEITLDDLTIYPRLTIRLNGKGIEVRDRVPGSEIGTKKQFIARKGQLVLSKIDARNGAFGILPPEGDLSIITGNFWAFDHVSELVDTAYLEYFTKTKAFIELCVKASSGTTNRLYLQEDKFLLMEIPLPPLPEQRRLVERIDALAAKIEEAKQLRTRAAFEAGHILQLAVDQEFHALADRGCRPRVPLREAATIRRGKFAHRPRNEPRFYGGCYPFIQIGDISASRRYIRDFSQTLNEQGLAISRMFPKGTVAIAITGATIGVTGILDFDSCFPDSIVGIEPISGITSSEFIFWALEFEKHHALAQATQTTQPNINLQKLNSLSLYLPPLDEQIAMANRLDTVVAHIDLLEREQNGSSAELDAMLPAILDRAFRGGL